MRTVRLRGVEYSIHSRTGKVLESRQGYETHVHGYSSGSGPVSVSSSSTVHDTIFIVDAEGKEHSLQLSGFGVACRPGHTISVFWAIRAGEETGRYFLVHVHETGESVFHPGSMARLFPAGLEAMFNEKVTVSGCLTVTKRVAIIGLITTVVIVALAKANESGSTGGGLLVLAVTVALGWIASTRVKRHSRDELSRFHGEVVPSLISEAKATTPPGVSPAP